MPHGERFWDGHPALWQLKERPLAYWSYRNLKILHYIGHKEVPVNINFHYKEC